MVVVLLHATGLREAEGRVCEGLTEKAGRGGVG